ncbi:MAG: glutaredoxin family protein [Patescibacteria group bacterium]|jgi:glutaredoxin-like YruB-family protein
MSLTLYSTPTCPWCIKTKELLQELGISYEEIDVSLDEEKSKEMLEKTGQIGVPVIISEKGTILGFDEVKIRALKK